ncbi:protease inhibitor I42 family protein [Stutzerimonas kirkiae]|uniref:protease inhibitor I42 family protein n=1 Tax=Stutzerimonas kirkiae TaxID=2211392 RepID=UPI00103834AE|nr:protease inhibitor I42 family protein [Stutzerimonas kirkiae]TBV08156.1 peptidase inhibitor I42 [Stutzerimonas kirkiae]TBV17631.1 peptidase inhibitor I42 [Stutzerimonas kirkiae]
MSGTSLRLLSPIAALLLGACSATPSGSGLIVNDDKNCPLKLQSGQTLTLDLVSNPSTGYRWKIEETSGDILKSLGPEVFHSSRKDVVGADGTSTWRFQAIQPGTGRLILSYQRPWENNSEPADLFDCRIEVE